ncbi:MAG: ATP-binding protein [Actinomycetota bacterium]
MTEAGPAAGTSVSRAGGQLRIAPDPALAATARLFAAAIARDAGIGEDRIDDLKLAVTETCAAAIDAASEAIEIEAVASGDGVFVRVRADGIGRDGSAPDAPIGRLELVRALFDDTITEPDLVGFTVPRN